MTEQTRTDNEIRVNVFCIKCNKKTTAPLSEHPFSISFICRDCKQESPEEKPSTYIVGEDKPSSSLTSPSESSIHPLNPDTNSEPQAVRNDEYYEEGDTCPKCKKGTVAQSQIRETGEVIIRCQDCNYDVTDLEKEQG